MADQPEHRYRHDAGHIAKAAWPLYVTMLATTGGATVDAAVLGHFATASLASFTVAMAVFIPVVTAVTGTLRGVIPLVATNAGDRDALAGAVRDGTWLALTVGAAGSLAVVATRVFAGVAGVETARLTLPASFLMLLVGSVMLTAVGTTATSALVGLGRGHAVLRAGVAGTAVGIAGSLTLVSGVGPLPELGITGTGAAMLASSAVIAVVVWTALARLVDESPSLGRPHLGAVVHLARVGVPLGATVLVKFAVLGVVGLAAARLGVVSAAAHSVGVSLVNLVFSAAVAVGQGTVPLVASRAGTGDSRGVRTGVGAGVCVAVSALGLAAAALALFYGDVIAAFTPDPVVAETVRSLLPLVLLVVAADGVQAVVGFGLVGLQRTMPSFTAFALLYGSLAAAAIPVAEATGLDGLWGAVAAANVLLVGAQTALFRRHSSPSARLAPLPAVESR
jgi:MATE family multidrug resistance protein